MSIFARRNGKDPDSGEGDHLDMDSLTEELSNVVEMHSPEQRAAAEEAEVPEPEAPSRKEPPRGTLRELEKYLSEIDGDAETLSGMEDLLAQMKMRSRSLREFTQKWRVEAVRHQEVISQRDHYLEQSVAYAGRLKKAEREASDLALKIDSFTQTNEMLKGELKTAQREIQELRNERNTLEQERDKLWKANDDQASQIEDLQKIEAKAKAEADRLRALKAELESALNQSRDAEAEAQFQLTELREQLSVSGKLQEDLLAEQERTAEERRSYRRQVASLESRVADYEMKIERLQAENHDGQSRLSSEKFAMQREVESLRTELRTVGKARSDTEKTLQILRTELADATRDRDAFSARLAEISSSVETGRKDLSSANLSISELNLKYAADLISLDQVREENKELMDRLEVLQSENKRLSEYEIRYRSSELRVSKLESKLQRASGDEQADQPARETRRARPAAEEEESSEDHGPKVVHPVDEEHDEVSSAVTKH